jgi:hypothetical protein
MITNNRIESYNKEGLDHEKRDRWFFRLARTRASAEYYALYYYSYSNICVIAFLGRRNKMNSNNFYFFLTWEANQSNVREQIDISAYNFHCVAGPQQELVLAILFVPLTEQAIQPRYGSRSFTKTWNILQWTNKSTRRPETQEQKSVELMTRVLN